MKPLRGVWYAIGCSADAAPPLARIRAKVGDTADVYYYRALSFCKSFQRRGCLYGLWEDLAVFVRWPEANAREMERVFVDCGLCSFDGYLYGWHEWNGKIISAMDADAKYRKDKYAREKKSRKAKQVKRKKKGVKR